MVAPPPPHFTVESNDSNDFEFNAAAPYATNTDSFESEAPPLPPPPLEPISTPNPNPYPARYEYTYHHVEQATFPVLPPEVNGGYTANHNTYDYNHNQLVTQPQPEEVFECPECDKTYNSESRLRRHQLYHLDISQRPFKCPYCVWSFVQQSELKRHVARKHPSKPTAVIAPKFRVRDYHNLPQPIGIADHAQSETDELHPQTVNTSTSTTSTMHEDEDETLEQIMDNLDAPPIEHQSDELDEQMMQIPSPPPVMKMNPNDVDDGDEDEEDEKEAHNKIEQQHETENEQKKPEEEQRGNTAKKPIAKKRRRRFRLRRKRKSVMKDEVDATETDANSNGKRFKSPRLNARYAQSKKATKYDRFFDDDFDDGEGYKCKVCGNLFKKKQHLIDHEPIHKKAKPFTCKYCLKPFKDLEKLEKHQDSHSFID